MKKALIVLILILATGVLVLDYQRPTAPTAVLSVEVLSVADAPEGNGYRDITVRVPSEAGNNEWSIKTLTPFYYRPGDTAYLGRYERRLFPDIYDFVSKAS